MLLVYKADTNLVLDVLFLPFFCFPLSWRKVLAGLEQRRAGGKHRWIFSVTKQNQVSVWLPDLWHNCWVQGSPCYVDWMQQAQRMSQPVAWEMWCSLFLPSGKWVPLLLCVAGFWKWHWWVLPPAVFLLFLLFIFIFFFKENGKVTVSHELPSPCLNSDRVSGKGTYPWISLIIFPHTEDESSPLSGCC